MSERPIVQTQSGAVSGIWRGDSAAFLGIPYAAAPVGELRFEAPRPHEPWAGIRDAGTPGPTPQRRPFAEVTSIPEPSYPGEETLNVNVFSPAAGLRPGGAALPVLVWIHGGGFFAGSAQSPWYDGATFNRDGVVTVSLSYRLGFEGFGWIQNAPTNRGLLDQIAALQWVHDNIAAFGGDPSRVTIAGQSAGGASVIALLSSPLAQGLFSQVICQSGADLVLGLEEAEEIGRDFARRAGVEPTRAGWSGVSEDSVLDLQAAVMAPGPMPDSPAALVAGVLATGGMGSLPMRPMLGDAVLPEPHAVAFGKGIGTDKRLLAGTNAHEFTIGFEGLREAWAGVDAVGILTEGGLPASVAQDWVKAHPELPSAADQVGQLVTSLGVRSPTVAWADVRPKNTWVYDFRFVSAVFGLSLHCLELPFTWDILGAAGVEAQTGANPPQALATQMHGQWVRFISGEDLQWDSWDGHNAQVFGGDPADQGDHYAIDRELAALAH